MIAIKVVTPRGRYLECDVMSIHCKSVEGEMTILPNHIPIFASLVPCKLVLESAKGVKEEYALSGGLLQFDDNKSMILTDAIEGRDEIDIPRAEAALKRAQERLARRDSNTNMKRAEAALKRAVNRISVKGY
ncbi:MAG: ATP synthase F1 subunit epsilon [Holdemanella sp.]|nr:ATP synthase F1 subunit epsilon [Holdemanella sp.]